MKRYASMTCRGHFLCVLLTLCVGLSVAGTARAVVIDDFTVGAANIVANDLALDESQPGLSPDHVLGGRRGIGLWGNSGDASLLIDTTGAGKAVVDVTSGSGYLTLAYGSTEDPLNLNLEALGHDAIRLRYRLVALGTFGYVPGWYRVYGTGNQISIPFANTAGPDIIEVISPIPASNDLADIDRIELEIIRIPEGTTIELIDIVTVPEPALALALLSPVLLRRR